MQIILNSLLTYFYKPEATIFSHLWVLGDYVPVNLWHKPLPNVVTLQDSCCKIAALHIIHHSLHSSLKFSVDLILVCTVSNSNQITPKSEVHQALYEFHLSLCFSEVTSLTDDVPRSEMICMLAIPTTMTSPDLLQFVAPVE